MSWTKKALSLGTTMILILAGVVFLNGRLARAAQEAKQATAATAQAPVEAPMTEKEVVKLIKHNKHHLDNVAKEVQTRGLDFEFTPDIEKKLTKAGADENLITYMKQFTPSQRIARKASGGGLQVSPQEAEAYNKLKSQRDPDAIIQGCEAFSQQYPKSPLLTYVYALEATGYQAKNDAANVVKYGQKSLDLDPKNLASLLVVSQVMPQPQMLNNISDAEKQKRLTDAAQYAEQALKEIDQLPKKPNESNAAYQKRKDQIAAGAYSSLGMVHLELSRMALEGPDMGELAKAEQNYKIAITKSDPPSPADYYRLGEVYRSENKLGEAISAFSKAGQLGQGTVIEQFADQQVKALKAAQESEAKAAAAKH